MAWWNKKDKVETREITGEFAELVSGSANFDVKKFTNTPENAIQLATVWRCVNIISDSISVLDFKLYDNKKGYKELSELDNKESKRIAKLMKRPNPLYNRNDMNKLLIMSYLLHGNGYMMIVRDSGGFPTKLKVLNPACVMPCYIEGITEDEDLYYTVVNSVEDLKRVKNGDKGVTVGRVESYDMFHLKGRSKDGIIGESPLKHSSSTLELAYVAEQFALSFFKTGGHNGFLVTPKEIKKAPKRNPKPLKEGETAPSEVESQADMIRNGWNKAKENGEIPIMGDDFKWVTMGYSLMDSQQIESRKQSVIEICRLFGVSPVKVYDFQFSTLNNVEEQQLAYIVDTLQPIVDKYNSELNDKLLVERLANKYTVQLDITELNKADLKTMAEYHRTMLNSGVMTINEVRKDIGLKPINGGDIPYIQKQYVPLGTPSEDTTSHDTPEKEENTNNIDE